MRLVRRQLAPPLSCAISTRWAGAAGKEGASGVLRGNTQRGRGPCSVHRSWRCERLLLKICIKCCVIKPFFTCIFFFGLAHYNVQKEGGTIKPASAIHVGSVAFLPLWAPPPSPGKETRWWEALALPLVLRCLPHLQASPRSSGVGGSVARPGQGCVCSARAHFSSAGRLAGAGRWHRSTCRGCEPKQLPVGRLAPAPPCCFLSTAGQQCPQDRAEEAPQPTALCGGMTGSFKGTGACPFGF